MNARISCLTPSGAAAIAVIGVVGPDAWSIVRGLFRPASAKSLPADPLEGTTWFGHFGDGIGDEVLLAVVSRQPEPRLEIHCHGGRQVVRWLISQLTNGGCVEVAPETICQTDEAWRLLPHAKTLRTAAILLDQSQGAFARALAEIEQALAENCPGEAAALLQSLKRYVPVGRHLIEPWKVVIAGAPNAGKSSLLNALAGYQRSVVAPIPGTTRDVVTATLAFDGWPVEIADTAGLREGGDVIEVEGIERARRQLADADLCLWVIDITGPPPPPVETFASSNGVCSERILPVVNKVDQPPAWNREAIANAVAISAVNGEGLDELIRDMVHRLVPDPPPPGAAVPYSEDARRIVADLARRLSPG